jgi:hypothetical protein
MSHMLTYVILATVGKFLQQAFWIIPENDSSLGTEPPFWDITRSCCMGESAVSLESPRLKIQAIKQTARKVWNCLHMLLWNVSRHSTHHRTRYRPFAQYIAMQLNYLATFHVPSEVVYWYYRQTRGEWKFLHFRIGNNFTEFACSAVVKTPCYKPEDRGLLDPVRWMNVFQFT